MTYGEAWFKAKEQNQTLDIKFDGCVSFWNFKHKSRMTRTEADVYYTNKINQEFERLGYKVKSKRKELSVKDFDSVECYYGYFEALKIMSKLNLTLKHR